MHDNNKSLANLWLVLNYTMHVILYKFKELVVNKQTKLQLDYHSTFTILAICC